MSTTTIHVDPSLSAESLQSLIDTAETGSEIHFTAGTYSYDRTIVIQRDDISLIGAGSGQTVFAMTEDTADQPLFQVGHELYNPDILATTVLTLDATKGSTSLHLAEGHGLQAGDVIYIEQENTDAFLDSIGDELWRKDSPLRVAMVEITEVNGNNVSLAEPLPFDYDLEITEVQSHKLVENVALSGFSIVGPYGDSDPGQFSNLEWQSKGATALLVAGSRDVDLSDIEMHDVPSHGLTIDNTIDLNVDGLLVDGSHNKGSGGNGYAVWLRNVFDSNLEDLTLLNTRHAVLFGSYNTAIGNTVTVEYTNRDVNFHGGLDQDNTVQVISAVRQGDEQGYMAGTSFFNYGTSYGAPTDPEANTLTFENVVGTVRSDVIWSSDNGSIISTLGAADIVYGGAGDDVIDLGTGSDRYYASTGEDSVDGNSGVDTAYFEYSLSAYTIRWIEDGALSLTVNDHTTVLSNFEELTFDGVSYSFHSIDEQEGVPFPVELAFEEPADHTHIVLHGTSGWERIYVEGSTRMGDDLEAVAYGGDENIALVGNDLNNHMMGGRANDTVEGHSGNDRVLGRSGDDILFGGDGDDELLGGYGNDTLIGGDGGDYLIGGAGADLFVATTGQNTVEDYLRSDGDTLMFNAGGDAAQDALDLFVLSGQITVELTVLEHTIGTDIALELAYGDQSLLLMGYSLSDF